MKGYQKQTKAQVAQARRELYLKKKKEAAKAEEAKKKKERNRKKTSEELEQLRLKKIEEHRSRYRERYSALGYRPINSSFDNSEFHHLHLNGDSSLGLYIPTKLHRKIRHSDKTGKGMKTINNAALLWLCEQSQIIVPSEYDYRYKINCI
jgi:hypothetical protein